MTWSGWSPPWTTTGWWYGGTAHDPAVGGAAEVWVGRLCELVTSLDPHGVEVVDGTAHRDGSAARDLGEWATIWLASPDDLATPGAWAALQDARNVAVTGEVPSHPGLTRLAYPA